MNPDRQLSRRDFLRALTMGLFALVAGKYITDTGTAEAKIGVNDTENIGIDKFKFSLLYQARQGDSLSSVSERVGCRLDDLVKVNPWMSSHPDMIHPGQILGIPYFTKPPVIDGQEEIYMQSLVAVKNKQARIQGFDPNSGQINVRFAGEDSDIKVQPSEVSPIGSNFATTLVEVNKNRGANAIVVDQQGVPDGTPVEVVDGDRKNGANALIRFLQNHDRVLTSLDKKNLKSPNSFPEQWQNPDAKSIPEDSVIYEMIDKTSAGIAYINDFYHRLGVTDDDVPTINRLDVTIMAEGSSLQADTTGININLPLLWAINYVVRADGQFLLDQNGKYLVTHAYQDSIHRGRGMQLLLHERGGHYGHEKYGFFKEFYDTDEFLHKMLEDFAQHIGYQAMRAYPEFTDNYSSSKIFENSFASRIIQNLDAAGENGQLLYYTFGYQGNMAALRDLYNRHFGNGALEKLRQDVLKGDITPSVETFSAHNPNDLKLMTSVLNRHQFVENMV